MANKAISELPQAQNVNNQDLFVLEQGGLAKKLTAETFITEQGIINALAEALDGHGGIQSVTLSSVSGRIRTYLITFTDQSATTFQVYDGTSIERISRTSSSGLQDTYTIFMSDGTTTFFTVHNGADGDVSEAMLNDALKDKAPAITETASGAIANFSDGADDLVMHNIVAEINPVQSGSGDPSPDNIRPISGWTGVNVTRTGKNLFSSEVVHGLWTTTAFYSHEGASSKYLTSRNKIPLVGGRSYVFSVENDPNNAVTSGSFVAYRGETAVNEATWFNVNTGIISVPSGANSIGINLVLANNITHASEVTTKNYQLELGSTATAYEPYQGETVTVDWTTEAGTVYGGTIDVATGLLTVDRVCVIVGADTGTLRNNGHSANTTRAFFTPNPTKLPGLTGLISDKFSTNAAYDTVGLMSGRTTSGGVEFSIDPSVSDTVSGVTTWFADNPTQLCYYLATPQTYQLTPQEVKTLLGTNNVWADTGNVSVTYPADTKMYIQNLTQPTEDDLIANQAITSGKYFMIGNSLYLALANIASGAQITIGTNAQRVSLADALNTINS